MVRRGQVVLVPLIAVIMMASQAIDESEIESNRFKESLESKNFNGTYFKATTSTSTQPPTNNSETPNQKFTTWKKTYKITGKVDKKSEREAEKNFMSNDERIRNFNNRVNRSFELGHNKYSDKSFAQNKKLHTGLKVQNISSPMVRSSFSQNKTPGNFITPRYVDYRSQMQPVKDQKDCGACYAFSALAAVEYFYKNTLNVSYVASEQNVVDCDLRSYGCNGKLNQKGWKMIEIILTCFLLGGWPGKAFQYAKVYGVADGRQYKQTAYRQLCKKDQYPPIMNISDYCEEKLDGDEDELKALVSKQPVVVGFHVTEDFMYYKSGIFSDPDCTLYIDHALLVVGYGTDLRTKKDYWIVRNSWSEVWGMNGYGYVARNAGNMCGIASWAMYIC